MPQTSTLMEFVLATHFETDLSLKVLDLADWARAFAGDFPIVEQLQALGRVDIAANPFQLVPVPELPLLQLISEDGRFYLKLQSDRFALGWRRTVAPGIPDGYPGFDEMLRMWAHFGDAFSAWLGARPGLSVHTRLVELVYTNLMPLPRDGKTPTLADAFSFMKPTGRRLNAFQMQWMELLDPSPNAARVSMSAGVATLNGNEPGVSFNFLGLGPVSGAITGSETRAAINVLHGRIVEMYRTAIISAKV